jgi:dihydrofolate reductase
MRKVILGLAVSLDGYIEGPNGEIDWCFTDRDYGMGEFFKRIDAVFMGRKSYELAQKMNTDGNEMPGLAQVATQGRPGRARDVCGRGLRFLRGQ